MVPSLSVLWSALSLAGLAYALPPRNTSQTIVWQACPELNTNISILNDNVGSNTIFDCGTLTVPLDYTDPTSAPLDLALFKVNATREPVLGTVLINFGGPGGTGALNLPVFGGAFQKIIGEQYNLLSWDPRGTGKTIPFTCNVTALTAGTQNMQRRDDSTLAHMNLTAYFLNGGWDFAGEVADQCYRDGNATGPYISTTFVARDMMRIVDALGEDGLLRYYGWSYGTALGSYVAAMFPDRMERVLLDGNVNPHDYQSGTYGNFLIDADKAFNAFLQECLNNKPDCDLAMYVNANSTQDMLNAINLVLSPLAANASTGNTAFLTYLSTESIAYSNLYYPSTWPQLASTITSILNGSAAETSPTTSTSTSPSVEPYDLSELSIYGIRGADAVWRTESAAEYLPQVEFQDTVSSFDSSYYGMWISARWKIPTKEQYTGNFSVKTKHPILYINGEFDPVTPLVSAYNASQSFTGSVVLPHSGYGHGIVINPSTCVHGYVQAYFANGTLPPVGTHCTPDKGPWELAQAATGGASNGSSASSTPTPSTYVSGGSILRLSSSSVGLILLCAMINVL